MVAQGSADGYLFENHPASRNLRATDIAAAYRIVLEAGGSMRDVAGDPLDAFPLGVERRTSVFAFGDESLAESVKAGGYA
jgi:fructose-1,6-bisphosphatase/inositol monophosphatase family enzyme